MDQIMPIIHIYFQDTTCCTFVPIKNTTLISCDLRTKGEEK